MRSIYNVPRQDFANRLDYFLDMLELRGVYKRQVRTLSLGEQMKCNFVASMLHAPELVILDEPTIGVDLPSKQALRTAILETRKENGTTFLLTTHIIEDITMAERILALDNGRVIFDGPGAGWRRYSATRRRLSSNSERPPTTCSTRSLARSWR